MSSAKQLVCTAISSQGLNLNKPGPDRHLRTPIISSGGSSSSSEIGLCQGYCSFAFLKSYFLFFLLSIFAKNLFRFYFCII